MTPGDHHLKEGLPDPLLCLPPNVVREGDHVILAFGDGRKLFAHCVKSYRGKSPPVKINRKSYPTANLIGLQYGTVLELGQGGLHPLPDGENVLPDATEMLRSDEDELDDNTLLSTKPMSADQCNDNRDLVDDNKSQSINQAELAKLRTSGMQGSAIVAALVENSSTFEAKTEFSKAKYIAKKQLKYQQRCRMIRCTPASVCEALYLKDPRKLMNMREDTLAQILSYSNVAAGCQVLLLETCTGVVTGALAQRMGGYGKILSIFSGQQPSFNDMISRFNLTFSEQHSIKWVHSGEVFRESCETPILMESTEDLEREERELLKWPCPLQDHTCRYLERMSTRREQEEFLAKRCSRFARKLTRHTTTETKEYLLKRLCDSVIVVARYDPSAALLPLMPFLAPSCPFVVFSEFLEPLVECFREIQRQKLAINLRLNDTWFREYQVLPGRTHPNMHMSQNGGFILTGWKLCPDTGHNELDDSVVKEIRAQIGGRRGRRPKQKKSVGDENNSSKNTNGTKTKSAADWNEPATKRSRIGP